MISDDDDPVSNIVKEFENKMWSAVSSICRLISTLFCSLNLKTREFANIFLFYLTNERPRPEPVQFSNFFFLCEARVWVVATVGVVECVI